MASTGLGKLIKYRRFMVFPVGSLVSVEGVDIILTAI